MGCQLDSSIPGDTGKNDHTNLSEPVVVWLFGCLVGCLFGWLFGWFVVWLVGWLVVCKVLCAGLLGEECFRNFAVYCISYSSPGPVHLLTS